jgi:hypothetical protein
MAEDNSDLTQNPTFQSWPSEKQHAYLLDQSPAYAGFPADKQNAYLSYLNGKPTYGPHQAAAAPKPTPTSQADISRGLSKLPPVEFNDLSSYGNATISGLDSVGRGVAGAASALGSAIAHPWDTIRGIKNAVTSAPDTLSQIPAAVSDINSSADPISAYGKVAQETAGQGAGQAAVAAATMGLPKLAGAGARALSSGTGIPGTASRVLQTGLKTAENFDVTKPGKSIGAIGDTYESTSQPGRLLSATNKAVEQGRANPVKTVIPTDAEQAISEGRANPLPTKLKPQPTPAEAAIKSGKASPLRTRIPASVLREQPPTPPEEIARAAALDKVLKSTPGNLANVPTPPGNAAVLGDLGPSAPPQAEELARRPLPAAEPAARRAFEQSTPGALGGIRPPADTPAAAIPRSSIPDVSLVPEPRSLFPGEQPNYMANVPREELPGLADIAKPGAGQQLQQLGKRVIYIPREALK